MTDQAVSSSFVIWVVQEKSPEEGDFARVTDDGLEEGKEKHKDPTMHENNVNIRPTRFVWHLKSIFIHEDIV